MCGCSEMDRHDYGPCGEDCGGAAWQPMNTAPRDGTPIQADIPGNGCDNIIAWVGGYYDGDDKSCSAWTMVEDQEPPESWDDGVCWRVNGDGVQSVEPTRWRQLQKSTR